MQNDNTPLLKSGLDAQKKYTPINIAVGKYIKALCKMLKVDFKETFPNSYPVYKLIPFPDIPTKVVLNNYVPDNENSHASENQTPAIDNDLAEEYINSLLSPIREKSSIKKKKIDRLSRSLKGIINSPDKKTSSDTEENVVIDDGIMSLFHIFTSIYKNTLAAVSKTDLINEKVTPYFISIFANPLTNFVYNDKNEVYLWNPLNNKYPEKLDISIFLANNSTKGKSFLNALCNLLKEYNKILIKDNEIISNYYIGIHSCPRSYLIYKLRKETLMQKVILESQDLSIDKKITFDKRNKLINKINNFLEENEMTRDIELIKTHSHNVHIIDVHNKLCEQIIFDSPSNLNNIISKYYYIPNDLYDFRSPYNLYNFRYHCAPKFIYDPNYKKNISLPVLLGLSPVKQDIFSACSYIKKFTYACDLIVQLASDCSIYQGNIIYFSPNMIEQQITRTLDGYRNLYLLNDYLFIVLEEKGLIINHSLREKEALVRIYDCIFNWLESKPICIIKKLPNTYEVKELTYINVHPSHKKQIIDFITFLTNKNYYILYCFIRIFKSIYNMEVYKRKGYIFLNCSEKIFSLYKKFLSIFNIKCGMGNCLELESTSELNKYDYIPEIIKASFGYAPIFINSIINSNTNNINKLLSGVALENYHIGRLNENGFLYGKFHCKNNVPILIYSDGKESSHKFINALKDYLYKLDFKNMEISDEEFENCSKFINSLDSNLIEYIVSCFSSYDGSPEDEQFDNETSAITDKECVIKFVKDCCKSSKNSIVFTADIYEIYKKYAYNELGISESNIDSSTFSKYFKEASKAESKRTNKGRGYINISINYDAEPLSKDKLIEMKATKEARENTAFDKLLNAVFI